MTESEELDALKFAHQELRTHYRHIEGRRAQLFAAISALVAAGLVVSASDLELDLRRAVLFGLAALCFVGFLLAWRDRQVLQIIARHIDAVADAISGENHELRRWLSTNTRDLSNGPKPQPKALLRGLWRGQTMVPIVLALAALALLLLAMNTDAPTRTFWV